MGTPLGLLWTKSLPSEGHLHGSTALSPPLKYMENRVIQGLYRVIWGYVGIMEKKMEATI